MLHSMKKRQTRSSKPSLRVGAARLALAFAVVCFTPRDALAYIDPGSGLLLIQGLLALIGGIIVFVKDPIAGIKRLWARVFRRDRPDDR